MLIKELFKKTIYILEINSTRTRAPEINENNEKKQTNKRISNQKYERHCFYLHTTGVSLQGSTTHCQGYWLGLLMLGDTTLSLAKFSVSGRIWISHLPRQRE